MGFLLDEAIKNGVLQDQYELEQIRAESEASEARLQAEIDRLRGEVKQKHDCWHASHQNAMARQGYLLEIATRPNITVKEAKDLALAALADGEGVGK